MYFISLYVFAFLDEGSQNDDADKVRAAIVQRYDKVIQLIHSFIHLLFNTQILSSITLSFAFHCGEKLKIVEDNLFFNLLIVNRACSNQIKNSLLT